MPDPDTDLFKALDAKHPTYVKWAPAWQMFRDVLGDESVNKTDYLPRNKLEPSDQYEFRVMLSQFIPETPLSVARIVAALYKEKPKRDFGSQKTELDDFVSDIDLEGQSLDTFMERVIFQLIGYGTTRILINVRSPEPAQDADGNPIPLSRADEIEAGVQPFAIPYSPLSVIDWDMDQFNELTMVRIKETRFGKVDPSDPLSPHRKLVRFIHYDRTMSVWWTFADEKEGADPSEGIGKPALVGELSGTRVHGLGIVPMIVRYWPQKLAPMVGNSYIRQMAKADIQKFQSESDQAYDTYLHAHPQLKVWTIEELSEIGLGNGSFLKLNPGGAGIEREDAAYVEAPTSAFEALSQQITGKLDTIHRHANTDPLGQTERGSGGVFQASGVARAWSFGTSEARILSDVADTAVVIERSLMDMALRTMTAADTSSVDDLFKGEIQYPEEFDLSSTQTLLDETQQISGIINSPTLLRVLHKRIAASKVGDITPEMLQEINEEIEKNPLIGTPVGRTQNVFEMPRLQPQGSQLEDEEDDDSDQEEDNNPPPRRQAAAQ